MSRHISTLNYLRSAATCRTRTRTVICWLSAPGITDSANKCSVSGGRFNQKSLARALIATDSSLKFPGYRLMTNKQYVTSSIVINHTDDCGKSTPSLVTFVLRHFFSPQNWSLYLSRSFSICHVIPVIFILCIPTVLIISFGNGMFLTTSTFLPSMITSLMCLLFFQPAMLKKRTIHSLDQGIEVQCRLGEAHHVERLLPSQCGRNANGTYNIKADREGHRGLCWIQVFAYCRPTIPQLLCCINFSFTNIHNYDNACIN